MSKGMDLEDGVDAEYKGDNAGGGNTTNKGSPCAGRPAVCAGLNPVGTANVEYERNLDFRALLRKVEGGPENGDRLVVEAYAYLAEDLGREKVVFKRALREFGFQVRSRPILYRADGTAKGDWDLGMAVEILERADRLDIVVLGTGDGDFLDLVQYLKEKKLQIKVEVICFDSPHHTSERLLQAADHVHRLGSKYVLPRRE